ncbi:hypothetical protein QTH87_06030 [Variovorax sp. J22P168]|uniref:hypothetical protein n=1 Tax=Variovorax jilinensis TaxID=3053513 RepID=UPI0025782F3C|nr:hypothetical protein [Variovorax sp. J22P168]MDM0011997.1 hypothetical protein [Variovorax sp. J22P168]
MRRRSGLLASMAIAWLVAMVAVSGCVTTSGAVVKIPVPVECRVQTPSRPAMPTELLVPGLALDRFAASALAEIEIREGYELELRAVVDACTAPVAPS